MSDTPSNHLIRRNAAIDELNKALASGLCNMSVMELTATILNECLKLNRELKDAANPLPPLLEIKPAGGNLMSKEELAAMLKKGGAGSSCITIIDKEKEDLIRDLADTREALITSRQLCEYLREDCQRQAGIISNLEADAIKAQIQQTTNETK